MSYINKFHDYVRDVPMEIGGRFFPPPTVTLPTLAIPPLLNHPQYSFDAEKRARQQFDDINENHATDARNKIIFPINGLANGTSCVLSNANEVLQPSRPSPSTSPILSGLPHLQMRSYPVSFEEFESRGSVFDELEWKTIDDKAVLSQILTSENSGSVPVVSQSHLLSSTFTNSNHDPISYSSLPPYPSLDFEDITTKARNLPSTLNSTDDLDMMALRQRKINTHSLSSSSNIDPLRVHLIKKGYQENLVNITLAQLPRECITHVEYYLKAMSMLEKRGVSYNSSLSFLIECSIKDKMAVINWAQTAEQLIGMGFDPSKVFTALISAHGERVKALDILLGISVD